MSKPNTNSKAETRRMARIQDDKSDQIKSGDEPRREFLINDNINSHDAESFLRSQFPDSFLLRSHSDISYPPNLDRLQSLFSQRGFNRPQRISPISTNEALRNAVRIVSSVDLNANYNFSKEEEKKEC